MKLRWQKIAELAAQVVVFLIGMRIADRYVVPKLGTGGNQAPQ